jgi:Outer membrane protein beta-barrel domain
MKPTIENVSVPEKISRYRLLKFRTIRLAFLSILTITMTVMGARAQGFHIGLKGGSNIVKIDGQSFDQGFMYGYSLGGFAEINFTKKWGIQPEVLWNQSKSRTAQTFNQIYGGFAGEDVTLNYLSIPVLITYRPIPLLSFQLGPQYGILINQNNTLFENGKNAFKSGDFSVLGGAQINLAGFRAGARYFVGLNSINDLGNQDSWKNKGFQLYIGIRII